jgi:hypothetical protein
MSVIPVGFAEVCGRMSLAGDAEEMCVIFGIDNVAPFNQTHADTVSTITGTFLRDVISNVYTYNGATISVGNDGGSIIWESTAGNGTGTTGAAAVPQNTALLFRKTSATGGRKGRGRMYTPGVNELVVSSDGRIASVDLAAYNDAAELFVLQLAIANNPMVILHSDPLDAPSVVTNLQCQPLVATQRRRLR